MRRIAVWNTAFLGDAVLTLPLVQSLRLRYPHAAIDFYVRGGLAPLFAPHPDIASVFAYNKRGGDSLTRLGRHVFSRRYDLWVSAHTSLRSALFAFASRAGMRIGYTAPALGGLFYTHRVDRQFKQREEIERLLALLQPLGDGPVSDWPRLALAPEAACRADEFFAEREKEQGALLPVLGLHPGSVWATKRWPVGYFAEIGRRALAHGAQVLVFGGPGEEEMAHELVRCINPQKDAAQRLHDLSGALSLPVLAAFLGRLSCYVTNDSGPMHMAWAQGTPVTALFGPTVRELGFFPRGPQSRVWEIPLSCRPCGLHGPKRCPLGHHHCMTQLEADMIWPDVSQKLFTHGRA